MSKLIQSSYGFVPAAPGFKALRGTDISEISEASDIKAFMLEDIIGWYLSREVYERKDGSEYITTDVQPMTPDGTYCDQYYIITPDGCVLEPYVASYASLEALIQTAKEQQKQDKKTPDGSDT